MITTFNTNDLDFYLWFKKKLSISFYLFIFLVGCICKSPLFDPLLLLFSIIIIYIIYCLSHKTTIKQTVNIDKWLIYQPVILWFVIIIPFTGFVSKEDTFYSVIYDLIINKDPSYLYLTIIISFSTYIIINIYLFISIKIWNNRQLYKYKIKYLCTQFDSPPKNKTSLHFLIYYENIKKINQLFQDQLIKEKDFYTKDQYGRYPIHLTRSMETLSFLIGKGVEVDKKNEYNDQTLLHLASRRGNLKMVDFLLKKGANINKKDIRKKTPMDYSSNNEMRKFLRSKGGEETTLYSRLMSFFLYLR